MKIAKAKYQLGSSPAFEGIQDVIAKFYAGERKELVKQEDGTWSVLGSKGVLSGVRVRFHSGRWRFEKV